PSTDEDLPDVWGLPAGSLRVGETFEACVVRSGREKLGVGPHCEALSEVGQLDAEGDWSLGGAIRGGTEPADLRCAPWRNLAIQCTRASKSRALTETWLSCRLSSRPVIRNNFILAIQIIVGTVPL